VGLLQKVLPMLPDMTWLLIYYFLAGLFTFLLAREWGASPEGALLGAAASPMHRSPLQLIVCIEIGRANGKGPEVPVELTAPYREALHRLPEVVHAMTGVAWDEEGCLIAASAMAVANGHARLAEAFLELEPALLRDFLEWVRTR